ncbi:MAG TPA: HEAT repeat domain-containing protein [Planctomycetota bacterium]|nr:HEAT repeat domain-containing protein [Planctomycetota bacterium]
MIFARLVVASFALAAVVPAQAGAPSGGKLEDLRDWARGKVAAQEGALKEQLDKYSAFFKRTPHGADTAALREAVSTLADRASVFADQILDRIVAADSADVKKHFADVLVQGGDASLARACLARVPGADEETAALLVRAAGRMKGADVAATLKPLAEGAGASPVVQAEAVVAAARLGVPEAAAVARARIEHEKPVVRRAACEALGLVGQGRDDVELLRKRASDDADASVKHAALRALGRFKGDVDGLKTLHHAATAGDLPTVMAALDGLEAAGTRDLSQRPLLDVVKTGPAGSRERAARVLMTLGSPDGVNHLFQRERRDAEQNSDDRELQVGVADKYREYGWYTQAIHFYDRALSTRGGQVAQQQILVGAARCYARLRRFDDAKKKLKQAGYTSLRGFAEDADFAEMRESPSFRELFK